MMQKGIESGTKSSRMRWTSTWLETVKEKKVIEVKGEELDETMAACILTIAQLDGGTEAVIRERCSILRHLNRDLWALLQAKTEERHCKRQAQSKKEKDCGQM